MREICNARSVGGHFHGITTMDDNFWELGEYTLRECELLAAGGPHWQSFDMKEKPQEYANALDSLCFKGLVELRKRIELSFPTRTERLIVESRAIGNCSQELNSQLKRAAPELADAEGKWIAPMSLTVDRIWQFRLPLTVNADVKSGRDLWQLVFGVPDLEPGILVIEDVRREGDWSGSKPLPVVAPKSPATTTATPKAGKSKKTKSGEQSPYTKAGLTVLAMLRQLHGYDETGVSRSVAVGVREMVEELRKSKATTKPNSGTVSRGFKELFPPNGHSSYVAICGQRDGAIFHSLKKLADESTSPVQVSGDVQDPR